MKQAPLQARKKWAPPPGGRSPCCEHEGEAIVPRGARFLRARVLGIAAPYA